MPASKQGKTPSISPMPPDGMKLEDQLCFPLYAASREIIKRYKPMLDRLDLTYTQYITMLVLWDRKDLVIRDLCRILMLDYGTLSPVLKKLEAKGLVTRRRAEDDERKMSISATDTGMALRARAACIPAWITDGVALSREDRAVLRRLLFRFLGREELD